MYRIRQKGLIQTDVDLIGPKWTEVDHDGMN